MDTFLGMWDLVSWHITPQSGEKICPFGENPEGHLIYLPNGFMSVHLGVRDREKFTSEDALTVRAEEAESAFRSYSSYCGRYEVHADRVVHHIEMSLHPNWIGKSKTRYYKFIDDQLILTCGFSYKGADTEAVIIWRKNN